MNRALRAAAFIALTFLIGRTIANIFLEWPAPMPQWLFLTTVFMLRITGLGDETSTDNAEVMATIIIACISWTLTALALWQLKRALQRRKTRPKT
jgi:hypothetical protein